jgi:predicted Zn finger-like uncharacterized protein
MLVTCPECGARYEIEGSLIPREGRRVQCSACENVWLETPHEPDPGGATPASAGNGSAEGADEPAAHYVHPHRKRAAEPDADIEEAPLAHPPLAEEVKSILREEAERDTRLRRERGMVEIQPELALAPGAAGHMRRPHAHPSTLPDPDEINATLRTASRRTRASVADSQRPARSGFLAGLFVGLCLVGLAALVYATAPRIAGAVPAAQPALTAYVGFVDDLRVALDRAVSRAGSAVSGLIQSGS